MAVPSPGFVKRFLVRFTFAYLVLYSLPILLGFIPFQESVDKVYRNLAIGPVSWVAKTVFQLDVVVQKTGSGDTTYDYVRIFCIWCLALVAGLGWTIFDRKRRDDERIGEWLRVFVRYSLAAAMIVYGAHKIFSAQFGTPGPEQLLRTYGDSSPMGLLWTFMGYSRVYTLFAGLAEMAGGLLLVPRRTALLGALLSFGVLANVVLLNFCYDVPVKLFSSHLLGMAALLILPDLRRLAYFFLWNRTVAPAEIRPLFQRPRLHRAALVLRTVLVAGFAISWLYLAYKIDVDYTGTVSKTPLYGIWEVEEYVADGRPQPPLVTDETRWRRLVFEAPGYVSVHGMHQLRPRYYVLQVDAPRKRLVLTDFKDPKWRSVLAYRQTGRDALTVSGKIDGRDVTARLRRTDESKFLLLNRGFHWINERPYNR